MTEVIAATATCAEQASVREVTTDEIMTVVAARELRDGVVCFVGIGLPSTAANLARLTHAPSAVLIYESGTIGAKPTRPPLSIGDGELAETADAVVSVPEIFSYWLQAGRVDVGFLGAAQVDRFGNINTTVVGAYEHPKVRLPGAGGAPEIAASAKHTFIMLRQNPRTFVDRLDFRTSVGHADGGLSRGRLGMTGSGPQVVISLPPCVPWRAHHEPAAVLRPRRTGLARGLRCGRSGAGTPGGLQAWRAAGDAHRRWSGGRPVLLDRRATR
jgi:glutaconate CoA-transferase subunit B